MSDAGSILASGQAAIEAALSAVPQGAEGALVVVATTQKQTFGIVTRIPGTERWHVGGTISREAGKIEASVMVRGTW